MPEAHMIETFIQRHFLLLHDQRLAVAKIISNLASSTVDTYRVPSTFHSTVSRIRLRS